jgi:hypothetical protein
MTPQETRRCEMIESNILASLSQTARDNLTPGESHHIKRYATLCTRYPGLTQPLILHFKAQLELRSQIPIDLFYDLVELYRRSPDAIKPLEMIVKQKLKETAANAIT